MFLAILGTASYTYIAYRQAAADLVMERDRQVTYLSAARLQAELSKFSQTLASVARAEGIRSPEPGVRQAVLEREAFRLADFDGGVVLLDHLGRVVAAQPPTPDLLGEDWSRHDLYRQVLSTHATEFDNSLPAATENDRVVSMAVPVLGEGEEFAGALIGMFRLGEHTVSSFYASIVRLRLGQEGNLYVVDGSGIVLYDSSSVFVGQRFGGDVIPGLSLQGDAGTIRRRDVHGREMLISYAAIPGTPWTLVTEEDWRTLTRSTRPYANLLLGALAIGMVIPAAAVGVLVRQRNQEGLAQAHSEQLARAVHEVRQALTPGAFPLLPGWEAVVHRATRHSGGHRIDDHLLLPDGRLMISLLQVTGDGLNGALSMISGRAALRGAAQCGLDPSEALRRANDVLCLEAASDRSIFGLYGILDPFRGEFAYAQAGLEPPLSHPATESSVIRPAASPLGVKFEPEMTAGQVTIPEGGLLILSAGLIEGQGPSGEAFGTQRLHACLAEGGADPQAALDSVCRGAQQFGLQPDDGMLVLLVKRDDRAEAGAPCSVA
jgi:serine phosphatase RsbU (regulator of sigma subunit)